ncbi:hypothetical protein ACWIEX_11220 [Bosea sp. NPDC055353]
MSFIGVPDCEKFHMVRAAEELRRLLSLSVVIVLLRPLFDEPADISPPSRVVETEPVQTHGPYPIAAVVDYLMTQVRRVPRHADFTFFSCQTRAPG